MRTTNSIEFQIRKGKIRYFKDIFDTYPNQALIRKTAEFLEITPRKFYYLMHHAEQISCCNQLRIDHFLGLKEDTIFDLISTQTQNYMNTYGLKWCVDFSSFGYLYTKRKRTH